MNTYIRRLSVFFLSLFTIGTALAASPDFSSLGAVSDNAVTTLAKNGDTITFTLTIAVAEDSDGVGQVTFDVGAATGLTATFPAAGSSTTHTATYAVLAGQDGAVSVTNITFINTGAESLINPPGFPHTPAPNVTFDNTVPTVTSITRQVPASSPTNADTLTWRVTFDEDVSSVDVADFSIAGTTATLGVVAVSPDVYDVTASGGDLASLNATATLSFSGGFSLFDIAGNLLDDSTPTGTNDNTYVVDNTDPDVVSITRQTPASSPTNADSLIWRVTFSEDVINVDTTDFVIAGTTATVSGVAVQTANTVFDITVSGGDLASLNATATLTVSGGHNITDNATNVLSSTTPTGTNDNTYIVDNAAPTVTEDTAVSSPTMDTTPDVTINTDEAGTLTMGGSCGTSSSTSLGSGNTIITLTQPDNSTPLTAATYSDCTVQITDTAGNANVATGLTSFIVDTGAPTVDSIVRQASNPTNVDVLVWRVSFSEDVQNVDMTDFTVTGTTGTVVATNLVTPNSVFDVAASGGDLASLNGTVTLSFAGGQNIQDLAANNLVSTTPTGTNDNTYVVDNTAPTVTENTPVTDPTGDTTPDVTINTDEAGTLTMGGSCGTSSSTTLGSGNTAITLTQADNSTPLTAATYADCTVQVTDAAGNANVATALTSFEVDNIAPVIAEVTGISDPTTDNTPDYTFSSDEIGTISYGGDCSSVTTAGTTGSNTVTFTTLSDATHSNCTVQVTDGVGNGSNVLNLAAFRVDTIAPSVQSVVISTSGNPGFARETQTVTFDVTFNEAVTVTAVNTASSGTSTTNVTTELDGVTTTTDQLIFTVQAGENGTVTPVVDFDIQDAAGLSTNVVSLGAITGGPIVADTTDPTLNPVSIASNNADPTLAITGNNVIVSFTSDETITAVTGTLFTEAAAVANPSGDNWTVTLMTSGDEAEGAAPLTVDFEDLAGNTGTQVTATTDASLVTYDNSPAAVSSVTVISNNTYVADAPTYYARATQTITVTIDPTEALQTPTGTILGLVPVFVNTVGDIWTATVTTVGGEAEGSVAFSIDIQDLAGAGLPLNVSATTDGSSVVYDTTAPTNPTTTLDIEGIATISAKSVNSAVFNWTGETDALAGVAEFAVRFENVTTAINESSTITLPTRSFTPAAIISNTDPYNFYISTVDKAGNTVSEALMYTQQYSGSLTGTVTDKETGLPIEGAVVNVISKFGETCGLNSEVCGAITDAAGNYEINITSDQEYRLDFLKLPGYEIAKHSFTAGLNDLVANAQMITVEKDKTQSGDQRVNFALKKGGEMLQVSVFSFSGEVTASQVDGGVEFTSFARITSITIDKEGINALNKGGNVWFIADASLTGSGAGSKKAVIANTASSYGGGFSGMTRAENSMKGRVLTPEESKAFVKMLNEGRAGETMYYTNYNGKKIFAGYVHGRLSMMVFRKNSKVPIVYRGYRRERQSYDKDQTSVAQNQIAINEAINKNKMLKKKKYKSVSLTNRYESLRRKMARSGGTMRALVNRKQSSSEIAATMRRRDEYVAAKEQKFVRSNGFTQTQSRIAKNREEKQVARLKIIKSKRGVASIVRMIKNTPLQTAIIDVKEVVRR